MTKDTAAEGKEQKVLTEQLLSREQFIIAKYLSQLKFSPRLWGIEEGEVWRALEKLCQLYEDALVTERARRELAERKLEALRFRLPPEDAEDA